jgi:hypothetical protein
MRRTRSALIVTGVLAGLGAVGGAAAALILTFVGDLVSGAPGTPGVSIYRWNVGAFALVGAVFGPLTAWSALRRAPLWRTIVEPACAGVAGTVVGILLAPGWLAAVIPASIAAAVLRLGYAHRLSEATPHHAGALVRDPSGG